MCHTHELVLYTCMCIVSNSKHTYNVHYIFYDVLHSLYPLSPSPASEGYEHSYVSAASSSSSESEFEPGYGGSKKRKKKRKAHSQQQMSDFIRMTSRKKGVISYKESSASGNSDSEKVELEGGEGVEGEGVMEVEDDRECIEKVLKKRIGKVGGQFSVWYDACGKGSFRLYARLHCTCTCICTQ